MILLIDVGNSNIKFGFYQDRKLIDNFKMSTDRGKTGDEYYFFIDAFARREQIDLTALKGVVICSVVPTLDPVFSSFSIRYFNIKPLFVESGIKTGLTISTENPKEVGADIVAGAVACINMYKLPCIIVSFGTATVFTGISSKKELLGVAIAPGIVSSAEALFKNTSKLPRIDVKDPQTFLGKNTNHSLQAGFYYGFQGMIQTIVDGFQEEMAPERAQVISTGGLCSIYAKQLPLIAIVDPYLNLNGLAIIYEKNVDYWQNSDI